MKDRNCGTKATHRLISKNKYNVVHLVKLYPFSKTIGNVLALTSKTRKSGCKITSVQLGSRLNISKAKKQKKINNYKKFHDFQNLTLPISLYICGTLLM